MPLINENVLVGLSPQSDLQAGRSNVDDNSVVEQGFGLPWTTGSAASYMYYDCTVGTVLDSGIVVHNRLPQVNNLPDSLSVTNLDDPSLDQIKDRGVNLRCADQYADIVQRMGHARYWFRIWGQALRVGYQVPIPGIKTIGGVAAVPYDRNPQWAFNRIFPGGNYSGVILWHAAWSLWYTTSAPPTTQTIPAVDLAAHIAGTTRPPKEMQAPYSMADQASTPGQTGPTIKLTPKLGG